MTVFAEEDFVKHINALMKTGEVSNAVYVYELDWDEHLQRYDELSWSDQMYIGMVDPKDFKQEVFYCVVNTKNGGNRCFLTFAANMEPVVSSGDPNRYLFNQNDTHAQIHECRMRSIPFVEILTDYLTLPAL